MNMRINMVKATLSGQNNKPKNTPFQWMFRSSVTSSGYPSLLLMLNGCSFLTARGNGAFEGIAAVNQWLDRFPKVEPISSWDCVLGGYIGQRRCDHGNSKNFSLRNKTSMEILKKEKS